MLRDRGTGKFIRDKDVGKQFCKICKIRKTDQGRHDKNGNRICAQCYRKFIWSNYTKSVYEGNHKLNPRKIRFRERVIILSYNPRKGICSYCGKHGGTAIHHIQYHDNNILKSTVELCGSCHGKEGLRLGQVKRDPKTGRFTKKEKRLVITAG